MIADRRWAGMISPCRSKSEPVHNAMRVFTYGKYCPGFAEPNGPLAARSCAGAPAFRIREEQLLAIDLVIGNGLLPGGRDQPIDEFAAERLFDFRVFRWIDQHDPVLIEQAAVAFDQNF